VGAFVASSGTYEVSANTLTWRPIVAKNPQVMAPGHFAVYSFKIEGKTLSMTEVTNEASPVVHAITYTYLRLE
jgi:hypothetical protein